MPNDAPATEKHLASMMERVTDGYLNRDLRATWRRRGLLLTPTTRAQGIGGRPMLYSRLALYEARLVWEAREVGIDLSVVAGAYKARINHEGARQRIQEANGEVVAGYLDPETDLDPQTFEAAVRSGRLREFQAPQPGEDDRYWLITAEGAQVRCVAGELVHLPVALSRIVPPRAVHTPVVVTNVSQAVRAVDRVLASA